jgi:SAM-dependent methyltransferase
MKPSDYYSDVFSRTCDWPAHAGQNEYVPFRDVLLWAGAYLQVGGRLLDIGCQGGHQTAYLAGKFEEAYGLDIADYGEMWQHHHEVRFLVHDVDANPIPFASSSFSTITCLNVLEHVFDVFGLMKEIARMLESGGTALLMVPNAGQIKHVLSLACGRVPRTGAKAKVFSESTGWDGQHLHYFTVREMSWLITHVGLEVRCLCVTGRLRFLKRICPSLLNGDIVLVAAKHGPSPRRRQQRAG